MINIPLYQSLAYASRTALGDSIVGIKPLKTRYDVIELDLTFLSINYKHWYWFEHSNSYHLHCTWLEGIKSCTKDTSHGSLKDDKLFQSIHGFG